jgi:2-C-methyl-D-erythritol 4-phosphate cytidylyltransferase
MAKDNLVDAVIVAAGQSVRFGSNKLLEDLCGRPIIVRTIDAIAKAPSIARIIIVVAPDQIERMEYTCTYTESTKKKLFVAGGERRQDSVQAGLNITTTQYVVIHDGARPLIEVKMIEDCIDAAKGNAGAVLTNMLNDSIKRISGKNVIENLNREDLRAAQTPQVVRKKDWIRVAETIKIDVSDDITMLEKGDGIIRIVEGNSENIKITQPMDLILARTIWEQRANT